VAAMSGKFTADETEKGQFLRGDQRNLAGEGVVRKNSSPQRVESGLIFAIVEASGQETWVKRSVAPVLTSESARFSESPA